MAAAVRLLSHDDGDLALRSNGDTPELLRLRGALVLSTTGFWTPECQALLPLPHTLQDLPVVYPPLLLFWGAALLRHVRVGWQQRWPWLVSSLLCPSHGSARRGQLATGA